MATTTTHALLAVALASWLASGLHASGQTGQRQPSDRPVGTIAGTVLDRQSNRPLIGATVQLLGPGLGRDTVQEAGRGGRFEFTGLAAGDSYLLVASIDGYFGGSYGSLMPQLSRAPVRGRQISVREGQRIDGLTIELNQMASMSGIVTNAREEPVVGLYVRTMRQLFVGGVRRLVAGPGGVTDDRGRFAIPNLARGDYVLALTTIRGDLSAEDQEAGMDAHSPERAAMLTYYPNGHSVVTAQIVHVEYGDRRTGLDMQLETQPTATIAGNLVGPPEALAAVVIRLVPARDESLGLGGEAATTRADADGGFVFRGVPVGDYVVRVAPRIGELKQANATALPSPLGLPHYQAVSDVDGLTMGTWSTVDVLPFVGEAPVSVTERDAGGTVEIRLNLQRTATVSGTIVAEGRSPSTIWFEPSAADPALGLARGVPDEGRFTVSGLVPGAYELRVGGSGAIRSIVWQGREITDSPLQVGPGDAFSDLVVTVTDQGGRIAGTVRDGDGQPVPGAVVVYFPPDAAEWQGHGYRPSRVGRTRTSSTGTYQLANLPAGSYLVAAVPDSEAFPWRDPEYLASIAAQATAVDIDWGDIRTVPLSFENR